VRKRESDREREIEIEKEREGERASESEREREREREIVCVVCAFKCVREMACLLMNHGSRHTYISLILHK